MISRQSISPRTRDSRPPCSPWTDCWWSANVPRSIGSTSSREWKSLCWCSMGGKTTASPVDVAQRPFFNNLGDTERPQGV